ncbi:MAG: hypothetical protein LBV63_04325 [Candidatus Methanoplasma sp.]|jgi:hypothetical protein|nr:hypothetical protein [Candidatus Methanoplasma sp.]
MRYAIEIPDSGEDIGDSYEFLSYESILDIVASRILGGEATGLLIRRHCCSSVNKRVLSGEEAQAIWDLTGAGRYAGSSADGRNVIEKKLHIAIDNWYMGGTPSLSMERDEQQTSGYADACKLGDQ